MRSTFFSILSIGVFLVFAAKSPAGQPPLHKIDPKILKVLEESIHHVGVGPPLGVTSVSDLIKVLQTGLGNTRVHAALALSELGPKAKDAIKPLLETLRDPTSWELRQASALALGRIARDDHGPDVQVVRALTRAFDRTEPVAQVRIESLGALHAIKAHKSLAGATIIKRPLERTIDELDQVVVIWARVLYAQIEGVKPESQVAFIGLQMQRNPDPWVRAKAIQGLAILGPLATSQIPGIIDRLQDKDEMLAAEASSALGEMRDLLTANQIADIARLLSNGNVQVRGNAAVTLGLIGANARLFIPALIDLLKDENTADAAQGALVKLKGELAPAHLRAIASLLVAKEPATRCAAARMLGEIGAKAIGHIPDLVAALQDKDETVAITVIGALASFGPEAKAAIPALSRLQKRENKDIGEAARIVIDLIEQRKK